LFFVNIDGASSRTSVQTGAGTPVTTTYQDGSGFPASSSDGTTYTTDDAGNLTQIDRTGTSSDWTYGFDAFNRMTCARQGTDCTTASGKITFAPDALDRAYTRTKGSAVTTYTYQGAGETPAKTVTGSTTVTYANATDGSPIAQKTGSVTRFLLSDIHGDVMGLVDTGSANKGTVAFDPWGSPLGVSGTETSWFGFQSDPTDPDTRQVNMGARWYESGMGRFSSRDSLFGDPGTPAGLNQFAYGQANPVTYWDPWGTAACESGMRCVPGGTTDLEVWRQWARRQAKSATPDPVAIGRMTSNGTTSHALPRGPSRRPGSKPGRAVESVPRLIEEERGVRDKPHCDPGESPFEDLSCTIFDSFVTLGLGEMVLAGSEWLRSCETRGCVYGATSFILGVGGVGTCIITYRVDAGLCADDNDEGDDNRQAAMPSF
jgi:RHS repeat-associated protein